MVGPIIGTPAPDATTTSFNSDGFGDIENLGYEASFVAPQSRDVLGGGRRNGLKTPGQRPLQLIPNGNQARPGKAEFTPLLKSVARTNISKRLSTSARRRGSALPDTPGMVLPRLDESHISNSSASRNDFTPMPQHLSSSTASTPLAQLPTRNGAVVNDGNVMTLREQEAIIDKIEKENFGLKMKIHFLEENLSKRGGDFNQAALKENTDLKVNRITMQRELHKFKKSIAQAERDVELYRKHLDEYKERVQQKKVDETVRVELANLKSELQQKDGELEQLRSKYEKIRTGRDSEADKLRNELADLQADLRDRDRQLEEREDEIDSIKSNANRGSNAAAELEEQLEAAKQEIQDLKDDLAQANTAKREAKEEQESAEDEKRRAEDELHELQDDMANKSIVPQGLSRQLEERATKFEDDYHELQERFQELQQSLEEKSQSERKLQERLRNFEKEGSSDIRHLQQQVEAAEQKGETSERKYKNLAKQLDATAKELAIKTDEKDLLQTRHDALTNESAQLQDDLAQARKSITNLEITMEQEKQRAAQNDNQLRLQHRNELDHLTEQVDVLHREASIRDEQHATEIESFASEKRTLEATKSKAEEKAKGLQRTVDKLNDAQGTLSGREMRLQEALESEKQRHEQEEKVLARQIDELNQDLAAKRTASDDNRAELNNAREELRISVREQALLKEKVTELEDEIEVLQADIEQEHELGQQLQNKSSSVTDTQLVKLKKEKMELQESLANLRLELETSKRATQATEIERDQIEARLDKAKRSNDDTFDMQQEKRELRRERQRLEKDLENARTEKDALAQTNKELEEELDAEIDRATAEEHKLNVELDKLRNQKHTSSEGRDKELTSAKNKVHRLESRIRDLEDLLEGQTRKSSSPSVEISGLRLDLEEARKSETAATKREVELKTSNRNLKMQVNDLERQLHEARLSQLKGRSPASSISSTGAREVNQLRQEVFDARAELSIAQEKYDQMREKLTSSARHDRDTVLTTQRESRGLSKELLWLKARLRREERLRRDLAWSKTYLENGMAMRSQCNQVDLRILREMGVDLDGRKYEKKLDARQKFRAGVYCVIAAGRMAKLGETWTAARRLGDELARRKKGGKSVREI